MPHRSHGIGGADLQHQLQPAVPETFHPPTYYLPLQRSSRPLVPGRGRSFASGKASPATGTVVGEQRLEGAIWSEHPPTDLQL